VGLVVARSGAVRNAMTVSLFSEVAHYPIGLWVSIAKDSFTHSLLSETPEFTFVTLHRGQGAIARACGAGTGRCADRCAALDLYESERGFLFLRDAIASTACRIARTVDLGTHNLFICDILFGDVTRRGGLPRHLLLSDLSNL
jgi:flavin reductase (DIM6/NTAB) family NADH-FMN oxidoreductase RutF